MVEKTIPPITAIPIGRQVSEPSPALIAIGTIPRMVVNEVINTGRRRERQAWAMASYKRTPLSRIKLIKSINTIPFFVTIPTNMIAPKAATILSVVFVNSKARITPVKANGMESIIMNGCKKDSNWAAITMYTNINDNNNNHINEPNDSCWSS